MKCEIGRKHKQHKFSCCLCGISFTRPEPDEKVVYVYPPEMLCYEHGLLVDLIMDEFQYVRGKSDWNSSGGWEEFVQNNNWILLKESK